MDLIALLTPLKLAFNNPSHFFSFLFSSLFFLLITLLIHVVITVGFNRTIKRLSMKQHPWYKQLLQTFKFPLRLLIWVLFFSFVLDKIFLLSATSSEAFNLLALEKIRELAIIGFFLWVAFNYISGMEKIYKQAVKTANYNPTLIHAVAQLSRLAVGLLGLLLLLSHLGISVASLATVGGIGAAGIAFAAKGIVGNFFGGLLLYMNRPFVVGERISSPDRSIEGVVEEIGWILTCVRDIDQRPLYIPNSLFSDIILINLTRRTHFRILTNIGLRYEDVDKIAAIIADIKVLLTQHSKVDPIKNNSVTFDKMLDSSLNISLSIYILMTENVEFLEIQQRLLLDIMAIIDRHKAECAFPSRSLYFVNPSDVMDSCDPNGALRYPERREGSP